MRAGDTVFAPDIDFGLEYHTNVYRSDVDPSGAGDLRIAPGLSLGVDSPDNEFKLAGEWEIRKYLWVTSDPPNLRGEAVKSLDRFNDFNVSADLDALKQERVGLQLHERATLRNNPSDTFELGSPFMTQVRNALGGGLRISPGQALKIVPGGEWTYDDFRIADSRASRSRFNARNAYGPTLDVRWDFFPRTALLLDFDLTFNRWGENDLQVQNLDTGAVESVSVADSTHVKVVTGISGRFTNRVFVDALVGYGTALYNDASVAGVVAGATADLTGLKGVIGSVLARYKIVREQESSLEAGLGYKRDFVDSFFTNYVVYDQLYGQLSANISDFRPSAKYSLRFESYDGAVVRHDILNRFDVELAYDFSDWGAVSAGVFWQQRAVAEVAYQDAEYDDVTFNLMSTFTY